MFALLSAANNATKALEMRNEKEALEISGLANSTAAPLHDAGVTPDRCVLISLLLEYVAAGDR